MPSPELSRLARELRGSVILGIADEIRALIAQGQPVLNLTVGDFHPKQFRIPAELERCIVEALQAGEANYPPAIGVEALRRAVCGFYEGRGGRRVAMESVLIAGGARPVIYGLYRALVDPGDTVVFGVPGWNNEFYCDMVGAKQVRVACEAGRGFLPTAAQLAPHLRGARLLALNTPLNPSGAALSSDEVAAICDAVLEENRRRGANERPLYVLYDQVYWMVTTPGTAHPDPVVLRPAIEPYLVTVDAISKCFASTGLRVGWSVAPAPITKALNNIIGHVGAWAPRPEQVACARFMSDHAVVDQYIAVMRREAAARLQAVYAGMHGLRGEGFAVDCLKPQGAIYASARFAVHGKKTPEGETLQTDTDIRRYLLHSAQLGAVPFGAFGAPGEEGWFRLSIGVTSVAEIEALMPRLRKALAALQ